NPVFMMLPVGEGSTVILKSAQGMYRPAPAACQRLVAAMVTLDTTESFMVSVQLRLPRLVAAVELPATSVGRTSAAGAAMLSTPPDVDPVTVCVPLAAEACVEPTVTSAATPATPIAMRDTCH